MITIAELKAYLDIEGTDQDTHLTTCVNTAWDLAEKYCNTKFDVASKTVYIESKSQTMLLPDYPVNSVSACQYRAIPSDSWVDETYTFFELNGGYFIYLTNFKEGQLKVTYSVGYSSLPAGLKDAILTLGVYLWKDIKEGRLGLVSKNESFGGTSAVTQYKDYFKTLEPNFRAYRNKEY